MRAPNVMICENVSIGPKKRGRRNYPAGLKPKMRRIALIYNPASGQYSVNRREAVQKAVDVFRGNGIDAEPLVCEGPGGATVHAREAVRRGFDAIVACGGDGTVHEILQTVTGTEVALGVIPLGTANALAANLNLIGPPEQAARKLLEATTIRIPVGRIHFHDRSGQPASRYFLVAAGVGADALLMSRLNTGLKRRFGYIVYLLEGFRIWATDPFPLFEATFKANGAGAERVEAVSQLLAVRVRSFGGVLRELAPGATLHSCDLHVLAFKTRDRFRYMRFLLAVIAGRHRFSKEIEHVNTHWVECRARNGSRASVFVEADGEVLGSLPVRIEIVPQALTLLIPPNAQP